MKALVLDGKVYQVCEDEFPVAEPLQWVDCADEVTTDWTYNGSFVAPQAPSNAEKILELKQQLETMEQEEIMSRGVREKELLTMPVIALIMSTLTTQQKALIPTIEAQLYAGNPTYKNIKDADTLAASLRAQITALK